MARDDVRHKVRLSDETSVASAGNNDPIYILRKEIRDWRISGQPTDVFEHDGRIIEDETEKISVKENRDQVVVKDLPDPGILHELPSSNATDHLTRRTENSSSPETCNDGVCSTTSPEEMTSVRTCYCKHEGNVARKKDNDIRIHNGNRHPANAVSKKSIITNNTTCGGDRESCKRARRVINEGTLNTNRSVEAQPSNPVLSPETSIALENAEKIINNAKIQLMEVCGTSSFDSVVRNRNTYSDEPPLDDDVEERLYVRELVTSKFHDACFSRLSEANGKTSARDSEKRDFTRVTVRRIDLSAPKFRVSRRRADWSSLGYGSDDRSRGRASPARESSRESSRDPIVVANETAARDDRARDRRRTLSARGNPCEIQIGPSLHIVDRELTRQDLEDVHISPDSSRAQTRANTATYTLCHDVIQNADNGTNDPKVSRSPRIRRVKLDTLQRGKAIEKRITEVATEAVNPAGKLEKDLEDVKNPDAGRDDGRIESRLVRDYRRERKDREPDPQGVERISECLKNPTSQVAAEFDVRVQIETPGTDRNEKLENKARNEEVISDDDTEIRYAEDGGVFCKRSGADRLRNDENTADKIQTEENQNNRLKPVPGGDTSRKAAFPRCENIASRCREAESPRPYRTIDRHFLHTFDSHNGQDGLYDVAGEDIHRRFFASGYPDIFRETIFAEDNLDEIDLYRPHLDDLDSILHFNDRKIERVARVARNLSELLSGPEFAMYKPDEDERVPRDGDHEKLCRNLSTDDEYPLNGPARSSILEIELRNEDLTISEIRQLDKDLQGTNAAGMKSTSTRENGSRSIYSKNSVESSVFPASDASGLGTSRDSDKARSSAAKARLSESSSVDRSDVTTFSNLVPALSSTHTETQACRYRDEEIAHRNDRHADAKSRVMCSASKLSKREIRRPEKEYTDDGIFARLFRKDASQALDRFVAYILQDEKRSIEGKVASALKESAVTPAVVQKLVDHLREAESIRDARQTETLDILRDILTNVKGQTDQGNDRETSSRHIPESSARTNAPPSAIDGFASREEGARQTRTEIDACEIERKFAKNFYEPKDLDRHSDFSECRETRESVRSTTRCESTRYPENNSKRDAGQKESTEVARIISNDTKNQTDKDVNGNDPRKEEILPRNVTDSLTRTNVTSDAIEETILRAKSNTTDTGRIDGGSNDSKNPDKYLSVSAVPETREIIRSAAHFETTRGSKDNSKNNSKGNSCSEVESLKQISDIRSDDNENPGESSAHLSAKIASAREEREMAAADSVAAIVVSENKDDINAERLGGDKSNDVRANTDQYIDRMIDARSNIRRSEEAVKEIASEKTRDSLTPADKRVLFALSEVSETTNERASSARPKFIDEDSTKSDVDLVHSSANVGDTGSLREAKIDPQQAVIKEISPADDNCDPPRDHVLPSAKNSESSTRVVASRNKRISFDIAEEDNSMRDKRNEEIRKSITFAAVENRRDGNEMSESQKTARSDNERQPIDLTGAPKYKINVLSSSNSSVSSALLDHDDRSTTGASTDARRIGTTPETSHSEGELYMPSSCSYSLGEVRVLRRKRSNSFEDDAADRDGSVTVLVTRSMLTSLNDSTVSLLESSGRV